MIVNDNIKKLKISKIVSEDEKSIEKSNVNFKVKNCSPHQNANDIENFITILKSHTNEKFLNNKKKNGNMSLDHQINEVSNEFHSPNQSRPSSVLTANSKMTKITKITKYTRKSKNSNGKVIIKVRNLKAEISSADHENLKEHQISIIDRARIKRIKNKEIIIKKAADSFKIGKQDENFFMPRISNINDEIRKMNKLKFKEKLMKSNNNFNINAERLPELHNAKFFSSYDKLTYLTKINTEFISSRIENTNKSKILADQLKKEQLELKFENKILDDIMNQTKEAEYDLNQIIKSSESQTLGSTNSMGVQTNFQYKSNNIKSKWGVNNTNIKILKNSLNDSLNQSILAEEVEQDLGYKRVNRNSFNKIIKNGNNENSSNQDIHNNNTVSIRDKFKKSNNFNHSNNFDSLDFNFNSNLSNYIFSPFKPKYNNIQDYSENVKTLLKINDIGNDSKENNSNSDLNSKFKNSTTNKNLNKKKSLLNFTNIYNLSSIGVKLGENILDIKNLKSIKEKELRKLVKIKEVNNESNENQFLNNNKDIQKDIKSNFYFSNFKNKKQKIEFLKNERIIKSFVFSNKRNIFCKVFHPKETYEAKKYPKVKCLNFHSSSFTDDKIKYKNMSKVEIQMDNLAFIKPYSLAKLKNS